MPSRSATEKTVAKVQRNTGVRGIQNDLQLITDAQTDWYDPVPENPNDLVDQHWYHDHSQAWDWETIRSDIADSLDKELGIDPCYDDLGEPRHPPPLQHRRLDGAYEFVEYLPFWTAPGYDPSHNSPPRLQGNLLGRLHPAQTPGDLLQNPTPFAQRFGIFPGRTDGRSRLSPVDAPSRRLDLPQGLTVRAPNGGQKTFIDGSDLRDIFNLDYGGPQNRAARESGQTFRQYLEMQSRHAELNDGQRSALEKAIELQDAIEADQKYQRYIFRGYTTEELIEQGCFKFSNDVINDLHQLPLHDLVRRDMWDRPRVAPSEKSNPRLIWRFPGPDGNINTGEWSAWDDRVWEAIQPALQLLTRFLDSNPAVFTGLMDLYTRFPIDPQRDYAAQLLASQNKAFQSRVGWGPEPDMQRIFPELATLAATGLNLTPEFSRLLRNHLVLRFRSIYHSDDQLLTSGNASFAETSILNPGSPGWRIKLEIGAEITWPLLSTVMTNSEKMACSFSLSAVILHELSHAVDLVQQQVLEHPELAAGISDEQHFYIEDAAQVIIYSDCTLMPGDRTDLIEPFFEGEPVSEAGFAVENQVFGGLVEQVFLAPNEPAPVALHMMMSQLVMRQWPTELPYPRVPDHCGDLHLLRDPPRSYDSLRVALSVETYSKYFRQSFWDDELAKYSTEALKLHSENVIPKAVFWDNNCGKPPMQRLYGHHRGDWLFTALETLDQAGYNSIASYYRALVVSRVGFAHTKQRWHYERQTWPEMGREIDKRASEFRAQAKQFLAELEAYRRGQQPQPPSPSGMLAKCRHLEGIFMHRLRYTQHLVRDYLLLPDEQQRNHLSDKHGDRLRSEVQYGVVHVIDRLVAAALAISSYIGRRSRSPVIDELDVRANRLSQTAAMLRDTLRLFGRTRAGAAAQQQQQPLAALTSFHPSQTAEVLRVAAEADATRVTNPKVIRIITEVENMVANQTGLGMQWQAGGPSGGQGPTQPPAAATAGPPVAGPGPSQAASSAGPVYQRSSAPGQERRKSRGRGRPAKKDGEPQKLQPPLKRKARSPPPADLVAVADPTTGFTRYVPAAVARGRPPPALRNLANEACQKWLNSGSTRGDDTPAELTQQADKVTAHARLDMWRLQQRALEAVDAVVPMRQQLTTQ